MFDESPYPVLILNGIGGTLLLFEGVFEVLPRRNLVAVLVNQLEREISEDPKERGEVLCQLLLIVRVARS